MMEEHEAEVTITFKRERPHPLYGKELVRTYETDFIVCIESSVTEDFSTQEIYDKVRRENKVIEEILGNEWVFDNLTVDSIETRCDDY